MQYMARSVLAKSLVPSIFVRRPLKSGSVLALCVASGALPESCIGLPGQNDLVV